MPTLRIGIDPSDAKRGAREYGRAAEDIKRESREMLSTTDRVRGSFARLKNSIFSVQGALASLGAGLALRKVIGEFADFERALIGVGKTADLQGSELQRLGREVQEIARRVPVATTELLGIAQAAGQLGVKGVDDITRFTRTVGMLGLASDLAGEEAATSLARILTVTGTAISDVDRLGSTIVRLGNNFAATEAEIASVATRVAQATSQFDVSAADVAGIATALRAVGVEAEAGGTQIGLAFQAINDALRAGGEEMQTLERITGQAGATLREAFFGGRSTEVFKAFVDGLGRVRASGGDVAAVIDSLGLEGVRAIQVLGTLATRSEILGDALGQASDEWERNDALTREAMTAATSFSAQMQLVMNDIDQTAAEIGQELAPAILDATGAFREFISEARETGDIKAAAEELAGAFQLVADNLDAIVVVAGALAGARVGAMFGGWGAPIGAVVGALTAMRNATVDVLGTTIRVGDVLDAIWTTVSETISGTVTWVYRLLSALGSLMTLDFDRAIDQFMGAGQALRDSGSEIVDSWMQVFRDLQAGAAAWESTVINLNAGVQSYAAGIRNVGKTVTATNSGLAESVELSEDWIDALEDAEKEVQRLSKARDDAIRGMKVENDVLRLILDGREEQAELLEFEHEMRERLGPLYAENADQLRRLWEEQQRLNDRIEAEEDARKAAEKAAEEYQRTVERATDDVVRYAGDTFADLFADTELSWRELWADMKQTALQTLARIAAEMVLRPVIAPIMGSVVGGMPQAFGLSQQAVSAAGSVGGAGGGLGGIGGASSLAQLFNMGTSTTLMNIGGSIATSSLGQSLGMSALTDYGIGLTASGSAFANGLAASPWGIAGSLGANLLGLGGSNQIANMALSTIGSIAGGVFGGPIGAAAGGFLGTALGGLFGGGSPAGNNVTLIDSLAGGRFRTSNPAMGEAGDQSMTNAAARAVTDALSALQEMAGVTLRPIRRLGAIGFTEKYNEWWADGASGPLGSAQEAVEVTLRGVLSNPRNFTGVFPALREAMTGGGSFQDIAGRIEEVVAARQQLVQSLDAMANAANDNVTAISTLEAQFEGLRDQAAAFNIEGSKVDAAIAGLRESANVALEREILALTDPQQLALMQWKEWAEQLRAEVEAMGADMVLAEQLIAEKRLDVLRRMGGAQTSALADWLTGQQLSNTSTLSPMDRLGVAQQQFSSVVEAARGGDASALGRVTTVADQLLNAGLDVSGRSTASFAALESMVRSTVQGLGQTLELPGFDGIAPAIDNQTVVLVRELKALRDEVARLREEQRLDRLQQAG